METEVNEHIDYEVETIKESALVATDGNVATRAKTPENKKKEREREKRKRRQTRRSPQEDATVQLPVQLAGDK